MIVVWCTVLRFVLSRLVSQRHAMQIIPTCPQAGLVASKVSSGSLCLEIATSPGQSSLEHVHNSARTARPTHRLRSAGPPAAMMELADLPDEMLSEVVAHLPMQAKKRFSLVSKRMHTITVSFCLVVCSCIGACRSADPYIRWGSSPLSVPASPALPHLRCFSMGCRQIGAVPRGC